MTRGITSVALTTAVLVAATLGGAAPADASGGGGTDTGWVPVGPSEPDRTSACGTTLTISEKVNKVESRTREDTKGNSRTDYRGKYVVRVTADDGRKVVLDNSGPYSVFVSASGNTYVPVQAPSLIYPFDEVERAAFRKAGLPSVFYYSKGKLELFITSTGQERVLTTPKNPVSICKLLR